MQAAAVATATGLAKRTAFSKLKAAREELGESAGGDDQAGDSGKEEGALKSPAKKSPTKIKSPTKKAVMKEETPETDAGEVAKKSPVKKKSPSKKALKKEEEEEEKEATTETDIVELPRQTRSGGVKRKNYADLDGGNGDEVEGADEEKTGREGKKTGK